MREDPFETIAIAFSQPQALVLLSFLEWHGFVAHARGLEHARVDCPITLALGGIPVRVEIQSADEARALIEEVAACDEEEAKAAPPLAYRVARTIALGLLGASPPPRIAASVVR